MNEAEITRESNWRTFVRIWLAVGALAFASCSSGDSKAETTVPTSAGVTLAPNTSTASAPEQPTLTFDDLGANSPIIQVYPGVEDTPADRQYNGTYNDGDTATAECETNGRTVKSVSPEPRRESNQWVRIQAPNGESQYATTVYVENPEQLLEQLQPC